MSLARHLINGDILNFIELSDEYSIVERTLPDSWVGEIHCGAEHPGQMEAHGDCSAPGRGNDHRPRR